jgi:hypothetical protein
MDLNDWDMAFPLAPLVSVAPDRSEADETLFTSAVLNRLRRYRDAVRAGLYTEDIGTSQLPTYVEGPSRRRASIQPACHPPRVHRPASQHWANVIDEAV